MTGQALLDHLRPRRDEMLASLAALVEHETPSHDKAALDGLARVLAARFQAHGSAVAVVPSVAAGDHLRFALAAEAADPAAPPGLVLCHFDTVWPIGTLATMPFRVDQGRAYGPGIFDMKASLVLVEYAFAAIRALGLRTPRPIAVLFTSDEETGSHESRELIESEARAAAYALVLEAPLADGRLKTARKGVGGYTIDVEGRAAHAGVEPEKGVNAIVEAAHQVLALQSLARPHLGTTINAGLIRGGSTTNVVPARATVEIDVRVSVLDEAARLEAEVRQLKPVLPGARLEITGGFNRPPMERSAGIAALFERARSIGRSLGLDLGEGSTGGASDGNFTAALGTPTLDGLGVPGAGAHATHEHILIDALPDRAALLAALLLEL